MNLTEEHINLLAKFFAEAIEIGVVGTNSKYTAIGMAVECATALKELDTPKPQEESTNQVVPTGMRKGSRIYSLPLQADYLPPGTIVQGMDNDKRTYQKEENGKWYEDISGIVISWPNLMAEEKCVTVMRLGWGSNR